MLEWHGERQTAADWYIAALAGALAIAYGLAASDAGAAGLLPALAGLLVGSGLAAVLFRLLPPAIATPALVAGYVGGLLAIAPHAEGAASAGTIGSIAGVILGSHLRATADRDDHGPTRRARSRRSRRGAVVVQVVASAVLVGIAVATVVASAATNPIGTALIAVAALAWSVPTGWRRAQAAPPGATVLGGIGASAALFGIIVHAWAAASVDGFGVAFTTGLAGLALGILLRDASDARRSTLASQR